MVVETYSKTSVKGAESTAILAMTYPVCVMGLRQLIRGGMMMGDDAAGNEFDSLAWTIWLRRFSRTGYCRVDAREFGDG